MSSLSPLDERYARYTAELTPFFGECALIVEKANVEKAYFMFLMKPPASTALTRWLEEEPDVNRVKEIERTLNHDTKAVEVYLQERLEFYGLAQYRQWIHWGITSQDVISVAYTMLWRRAYHDVIMPEVSRIWRKCDGLAQEYDKIPLLSRTHGQPATPTTVGHFFQVYATRIHRQTTALYLALDELTVKFGGTVGGLHIHQVFYPEQDWNAKLTEWIQEVFRVRRSQHTTQIDAYDAWIRVFQATELLAGILQDLAKNVWHYISLGVFVQKQVRAEVGSSVMPHKVNPIHWENAEGNLQLTQGLLRTLSGSLVESRFQRDMHDSTVVRTVGVPLGHLFVALQMMDEGFHRFAVNEMHVINELENHYEVLTEVIQHILRIYEIDSAYDILKEHTRGTTMTQKDYHRLVSHLEREFPQMNWDIVRDWTPHEYALGLIQYPHQTE